VDPPRGCLAAPELNSEDRVHRVCTRKSSAVSSGKFSTEKSTGTLRLPVENWCGAARAGSPPDRLRPAIGLGYPSRVCSIMGDAIDRIAEAIDQLASDAQGEISGRELAARVADLWMMVSALDPELARRSQGYTTPADGAPEC